jgi:tRNA A-37 threonylcarbamoyl transferase component Bud32
MSKPRLDTRRRGERALVDWHNAIAFYRRLSAEGLSPQIVTATDGELVTHWHPPLRDWIAERPGERRELGLAVLARVKELHGHGICHRDVHDGNIVVHDGVPLFIDLEFAIESDPERPCYDLYGPRISGVAVPQRHAEQLGSANANGVWWENAAHTTLASIFGTVGELQSHMG